MDTKNYESCLYNDIDGSLWDFFLTDDSLFYNIDAHGEFYESTMLMENVKLYDIAADKNGIYIVCLTANEELYFLTYKNNEWEEKIIKKSDRHSTIRNIHIYANNNTVHIFYNSIHDTTRRPTLNHFYNSNNKWVYNPVNTNSLSSMHNYFIDSYNNSDIIVFYYSLMQNKLSLHAVVFSHTNSSWSKDKRITSSEIGTNIANLFIDSKNLLHILYCYGEQVYWKKFSMDIYTPFIKLKSLNKSVLTENIPSRKYLLFEWNNRLWLTWEIENHICVHTNDNSHSWTIHQPLLDVESQVIKYICSPNEQYPYPKAFITYSVKINKQWLIVGKDDLPGIPNIPIISEQFQENEIVAETGQDDNPLQEDALAADTVMEDPSFGDNALIEESHVEQNPMIEDNTSNESIGTAFSTTSTDNLLDNDTCQFLQSESFTQKSKKHFEGFIERIRNIFH